MTEAESFRLTVASLRNVRRAYRKADTAGEVLERWLDRQLSRKTRTTSAQSLKVLPLWDSYASALKSLEAALGDFLVFVGQPK